MGAIEKTAEHISAESSLSPREAEVVIRVTEQKEAYEPAQEVYDHVGKEMGIQPTTVQTLYSRAQNKADIADTTEWFVHNPREFISEMRGHGEYDAPIWPDL